MPLTLADAPPLADELTLYDETHFTLYMRILDAVAAKATESDICTELLDIDPKRDPARAHSRFESHLRRAQWFLADGARHLVGRDSYLSETHPT
jgi:hypothetical protein